MLSKTAVYTVPHGKRLTAKWLNLQSTTTTTDTLQLSIFRNVSFLSSEILYFAGFFFIQTGGRQIDLANFPAFESKADIMFTVLRAAGNGTIKLHLSLASFLQSVI